MEVKVEAVDTIREEDTEMAMVMDVPIKLEDVVSIVYDTTTGPMDGASIWVYTAEISDRVINLIPF